MFDKYETRKNSLPSLQRLQLRAIACDPDFNRRGFVVVKNAVFDVPNWSDLAQQSFYQVNEPDSNKVRSHLEVHSNPIIAGALHDLEDYIAQMFKGEYYIHQSRVNYKYGFEGSGWHWHSDFETWHAQDGMPEPNCFTAMVALTQNTAANGGLIVMPGSHHYFWGAPASEHAGARANFANQVNGVPDAAALHAISALPGVETPIVIELEPGDAVFFHCNLLHCSNANRTPLPRSNLFFVMNAIDNRLVAPYSGEAPRPSAMAAR